MRYRGSIPLYDFFLFDVNIVVGVKTYPIKKIEKVIDTTIVNELAATKARMM